jgi:hypothetical protein
MPRPPRPRRTQRAAARAVRKEVRRTESLARHLPGASADHPIDVTTSAVVEGHARSTPCPQCGGDLELRADRASSTARGLLRELALVCRLCHAPRTLWFRITPPSTN